MQQAVQFDTNSADAGDLIRPDVCIDPRHLNIYSIGTVPQPCRQDPSALAMLETFVSKDPSAFLAMLEALPSKVAHGLPPRDVINPLPGPPQRSVFNDDFVRHDVSSTISHQRGVIHQFPYHLPFTLLGNSGELRVGQSSAGTME